MIRRMFVLALLVASFSPSFAQQSAETIGDPAFAATAAKRYDLERENALLKARLAACQSALATATTPILRSTADAPTTTDLVTLIKKAPKGSIVELCGHQYGYVFCLVYRNDNEQLRTEALGHAKGAIPYEQNAMVSYVPGGYSEIPVKNVAMVYWPGTKGWNDHIMDALNGK